MTAGLNKMFVKQLGLGSVTRSLIKYKYYFSKELSSSGLTDFAFVILLDLYETGRWRVS